MLVVRTATAAVSLRVALSTAISALVGALTLQILQILDEIRIDFCTGPRQFQLKSQYNVIDMMVL